MEPRRRSGKLAVILHADVAGSTTLVQLDENLAHQRIQDSFRRFGEAIARYHGQVRELRGDALLAEFERASDAVAAALAFQADQADHIAQLNDDILPIVRVGIALGEVIVADNTVTGAGVVLAQRVEQLAEHGGVCITGAIHEALPQRMPFEQENLGEQQVKGFDESVRVYRVALRPGEVIPPPENTHKPKATNTPGISAAVAAIVLVIAAGLSSWFQPWAPEEEPASVERMAFPLPEKPSIAVLPFDNLSGNPDQEFLADGLTEEIITTLSKSPNLFVIARNSTFTYKGKAVEVRQVAEEQGVRYVLEGSIQRSGDRVRINAQLIDALEGHHLWAERYDREFDDIFALQDDITQNIMIALEIELTQGEQLRGVHSRAPKPEAFEYMLKSRVHYYRFNKEDNAIARQLAAKAAEISPDYPDAWSWMGWNHLNDFRFGWSADRKKSLQLAKELADKAYKLDPTVPETNNLLASLSMFHGEYDEAISHSRKAVDIAPSNANAIGGLAWALCYSGYPDEAIPLLQQSMRLSPVYPAWVAATLGLAYLMSGDYPKAIAAHEQLIERKSMLQFAYSRLAAIYAMQGNEEKARAYAADLLKIKPDFTISSWSKVLIYQNKEDLNRELDALRRAGLPESPPLELPDKPSIAVLPFSNMSGDTEQDYFADGMTDDLITDLSKLSKLFVIARNSSFIYKGTNVDVREIAQYLNIRYVLEGSIRRSGGTIRINAQLIDAETGGHLWAERYDGTLENIFALQDKITQKIVSALAVKLTADERQTLGDTDTDIPQAYEYFLEGRERFFRYSKDGMMEARRLFERAVELDPEFAHVYAMLAWTHWFEFSNGWSDDPEDSLDRAEALAQEAISLNSQLPVAYFVTALVYRERRDYVKAVVEAEKAIRLDPNYANGRVVLATVLYYTGRAEEGLEQILEAMKLEPHHTHNYLWHLGQAYYILNRYDDAIAAFQDGLEKNPTSERLRLWLAATYAQTDQTDDASFELDQVLLANPELTRSRIADAYPFWYMDDLSNFLDALAKAGLE